MYHHKELMEKIIENSLCNKCALGCNIIKSAIKYENMDLLDEIINVVHPWIDIMYTDGLSTIKNICKLPYHKKKFNIIVILCKKTKLFSKYYLITRIIKILINNTNLDNNYCISISLAKLFNISFGRYTSNTTKR